MDQLETYNKTYILPYLGTIIKKGTVRLLNKITTQISHKRRLKQANDWLSPTQWDNMINKEVFWKSDIYKNIGINGGY